jgi:hypothetical protein
MAGTMTVASHLPPRAFSAIISEPLMPTGPTCGSWTPHHHLLSSSKLDRTCSSLQQLAHPHRLRCDWLAALPTDPHPDQDLCVLPRRAWLGGACPTRAGNGIQQLKPRGRRRGSPPLPRLLLDSPCRLETHCSQHGVAFLFSSSLFSFEWECTHPVGSRCPATPP